uniref:Uncharacterized protein n=1 Tax=Magallana gigas TaxID=29159 RepID=A0A8W8N4Q4_MAGGI|nr:uncharacterized protein LOC105338091 [Crassostrea gigas]
MSRLCSIILTLTCIWTSGSCMFLPDLQYDSVSFNNLPSENNFQRDETFLRLLSNLNQFLVDSQRNDRTTTEGDFGIGAKLKQISDLQNIQNHYNDLLNPDPSHLAS